MFSVRLGTGLEFGDGWISRVRRGVREPLLLRPPGTGGFRRGAGDDMVVGCWVVVCLSLSGGTQAGSTRSTLSALHPDPVRNPT